MSANVAIAQPELLLELLLELQAQIRDQVVASCEQAAADTLAAVAEDAPDGDTIYAIDRVSEAVVLAFFAERIAPTWPLVLIAEGLPEGQITLPAGLHEEDAVIRVIVDPIDGTRGLMYQKRSAWVLTGVAPNRGPATHLSDIALAVQTEIPLVKQHLCDVLWAFADGPLHARRYNRLTGELQPLVLRPSRADSIAHGFATISRFFPGVRADLAALDDALMRAVLGPPVRGKAQGFEDQYICSGGQIYELIAGHDRFTADLRPLLDVHLAAQGTDLGICCHPYDLAAALLAERAGVILTDAAGAPLDAPLDVVSDVSWIGYANPLIRAQVEPALQALLRERGFLP